MYLFTLTNFATIWIKLTEVHVEQMLQQALKSPLLSFEIVHCCSFRRLTNGILHHLLLALAAAFQQRTATMQACSPKILTCLTFITPFLLQGFVWQLINPELATALAQNRIINGTAVNPPHKYPWTVSIYYAGCFSTGVCPPPGHACGGAVLDGHFVITAAHCCYLDPTKPGQIDIKGSYIITGAHERNNLTSWSQNLSIAECIPHELYR